MAIMPALTRRAALRTSAGFGAVCAGALTLGELLCAAPSGAAPAPSEPPRAGSTLPTRITGSFISTARGGVATNYVIVLPPNQSGPLKPVIALHGTDGDCNQMLDNGIEYAMTRLVGQGKKPVAVIGVDGGNGYWHKRRSGEDSGAMVLNELLPLVASMGMDTSQVAFMGWSMGGYGALHLGAKLGPERTAGICAISPALYSSFSDSPPGAFDSEEDFTNNSVLGLAALSQIPLRVDCGVFDRFYPATLQFVNQLTRPPVTSFTMGGHDKLYWRLQLPGELAWLAS